MVTVSRQGLEGKGTGIVWFKWVSLLHMYVTYLPRYLGR